MSYVLIRFQLIDEFSDVNDGEKQLMKLWNLHLMRNRLVVTRFVVFYRSVNEVELFSVIQQKERIMFIVKRYIGFKFFSISPC